MVSSAHYLVERKTIEVRNLKAGRNSFIDLRTVVQNQRNSSCNDMKKLLSASEACQACQLVSEEACQGADKLLPAMT